MKPQTSQFKPDSSSFKGESRKWGRNKETFACLSSRDGSKEKRNKQGQWPMTPSTKGNRLFSATPTPSKPQLGLNQPNWPISNEFRVLLREKGFSPLIRSSFSTLVKDTEAKNLKFFKTTLPDSHSSCDHCETNGSSRPGTNLIQFRPPRVSLASPSFRSSFQENILFSQEAKLERNKSALVFSSMEPEENNQTPHETKGLSEKGQVLLDQRDSLEFGTRKNILVHSHIQKAFKKQKESARASGFFSNDKNTSKNKEKNPPKDQETMKNSSSQAPFASGFNRGNGHYPRIFNGELFNPFFQDENEGNPKNENQVNPMPQINSGQVLEDSEPLQNQLKPEQAQISSETEGNQRTKEVPLCSFKVGATKPHNSLSPLTSLDEKNPKAIQKLSNAKEQMDPDPNKTREDSSRNSKQVVLSHESKSELPPALFHKKKFQINETVSKDPDQKRQEVQNAIETVLFKDSFRSLEQKMLQPVISKLKILSSDEKLLGDNDLKKQEMAIESYISSHLISPIDPVSEESDIMRLLQRPKGKFIVHQVNANTPEQLDFYKKKFLEHSPEFLREIKESFGELHKKLKYYLKMCQVEEFDPKKYLKSAFNRLTQMEVERLQRFFHEKEEDPTVFERDFDEIDEVIKNLNFFCKFSVPVRMVLVRQAKWVEFKAGEAIFQQGDFGDNMYVIIRGSCNVMSETKILKTSTTEKRIIACLYDGQGFGEYSMLGKYSKKQINKVKKNIRISSLKETKRDFGKEREAEENQYKKMVEATPAQLMSYSSHHLPMYNMNAPDSDYRERTRRTAGIQCTETTQLIYVSREKYKSILLNLMQSDLDDKLRLISLLPIFDVSNKQ